MNTTYKTSALTVALGTALAASGSVNAAANPFEIKPLSGGYMQLTDAMPAEGKCGGSKTAGEGKCGGTKAAAGSGDPGKSISVLEGKCGEGKCGSKRVRQMMDDNGDGRIERSEYTAWATRQAEAEFDEMAGGAESVSPDDAFQNFLRWEAVAEKRG